MKHSRLILIALMALFASCSREIIIDSDDYIRRPVIEGYIENGEYPWVMITYNQPFFEELNLDYTNGENLEALLDLVEIDATVIVSNGIIDDTLVFMIDPSIFTGEVVWPPFKYTGTKFVGEVDHSYSLRVEIDENVYTATTTITEPCVPDTIWFVADPYQNDTIGSLHATFTDNPDEKNYYRYFTKRLGRDVNYVEGYASIWEDTYFNGLAFEVILFRGSSPALLATDTIPEPAEEYLFFKTGDTVSVKVVTMDADSYRFWHTLESSSEVKTNISGGALGVWCGYGTYYFDPYPCYP
ncbi:MAG: DUF4249 family protein [Bacteroidales bacterium]|nr:DUF4249 family protein [Bacteroidales bacterium]